MMNSKIKTRVLIISDTRHKIQCLREAPPTCRRRHPLSPSTVAIHRRDLTDGSKLDEFRTAIQPLKDINAHLKLVIAGNHDITMEIPAFEQKIAEATPPPDPELVARDYGAPSAAKQLFEEVKDEGIIFLDEGTHHFVLGNGAQLTVYASPYKLALGA